MPDAGDLQSSSARRGRALWLASLLLMLGACAREAVPAVPGPNAPAPFTGPLWRAPQMPARIAPPVAPYKWPDARQLWPRIRPPDWAGPGALRFVETVQQAATYYQLPHELLWAVIKVESNFRDQAVSRAGAIGLMQLMPSTAKAIGLRDARDPAQNILGGAYYLRHLANRFEGDLYFTLAAYNAGPGAVKRYGGVPPYPETESYVRKVLTYYWKSLPAARIQQGSAELGPPSPARSSDIAGQRPML